MPLLLLFIAVPLIEIALFIQLGSVLQLGWILLIVVLTAILGTYLVRQQGRDVLAQLSRSFQDFNDPTEPLAHGAMILFSGALLLTPGFFTDTIGFLLLVPPLRLAMIKAVRARVNVQATGFQAHTMNGGPQAQPRQEDGIIDGEFEEVAPDQSSKPQRPSGWTQ